MNLFNVKCLSSIGFCSGFVSRYEVAKVIPLKKVKSVDLGGD